MMTIDKLDEMLSEFKLIDIQISNKLKPIYGKYEVWRKVKDYENYFVSSFGRVRNNKTDRILKPFKRGGEYYCVKLFKNGTKKAYSVHRLVGIAFLPNHDNKSMVDHKDEIKTNNNILNLRWASCSQNFFNQGKYKSNTTGFKGVSFHKRDKKYVAQIRIEGKNKHLGYFLTAQDAGHAYDEYAKKHHKEFYYKK